MNRSIFLILLFVVKTTLLNGQNEILVAQSQIIGEWINPQIVKSGDDFIVASISHENGRQLKFTKVDQGGGEIWEKYTSLNESENEFRLLKSTNSFYIIGITSSEVNDTFTEVKRGEEDIYVLKYDLEAELQWSKRLGGNGYNILSDAKITSNDNIIVAGGHSVYHRGMNYPRSDFYYSILSPDKDVLVEKVVTDFTGDEPNDNQWIKSIDVTKAGEVYAHGWTNFVTSRDATSVSKEGKSVLLKFSDSGELLESVDIAQDFDYDNNEIGLLKIDQSGNIIIAYNDIINSNSKKKSILKFKSDLSLDWAKTIDTDGEENYNSINILEDNSILLSGESNSNLGGDISDINTVRPSYQSLIMKVSSSGEVEWTKFYETVGETTRNNTRINGLILDSNHKAYGALSSPLTSLSDSAVSLYQTGAIVTFEFERSVYALTLNETIAQTNLSACSGYFNWDAPQESNVEIKYLMKLNNEIIYAGKNTSITVELTEDTAYELELIAVDNYLNQSNIIHQDFESPKNIQANVTNNFTPNVSFSSEIFDFVVNTDGSKLIVGNKGRHQDSQFGGEYYGGGEDGIIFTLSKENVISNALTIGGPSFERVRKVEAYDDGYICVVYHNSSEIIISGDSTDLPAGLTLLNVDKGGNILWKKSLVEQDRLYNGTLAVQDLQIHGDSIFAVIQEYEETVLHKLDIVTSIHQKEVLNNRGNLGYKFIKYEKNQNNSNLLYYLSRDFVVEKRGEGTIDTITTTITGGNGLIYGLKARVLQNGNYLLGFSTDDPSGPAIEGLNKGGEDAYLVEIDHINGGIVKVLNIGGIGDDSLGDFIVTSSDMIKAIVNSTSPKIPSTDFINRGNLDALVIDIDWGTKTIINSTQFGGNNYDQLRVMKESSPGNFHFGGLTRSSNCDLMANTKSRDAIWLIDYKDEQDEIPPTAPTDLDTLQHENEDETLFGWNPATDNYGVAFYKIYQNDSLIGQDINTYLFELQNSDYELKNYQFKVTAVDYARLESEPAILDLDFSIILSTDDFTNPIIDVKLYPIPIENNLQIQFNSPFPSDLKMTIIDQYGHSVKHYDNFFTINNTIELDQLTDLKPGVYLLRIISKEGTITKRIVKF